MHRPRTENSLRTQKIRFSVAEWKEKTKSKQWKVSFSFCGFSRQFTVSFRLLWGGGDSSFNFLQTNSPAPTLKEQKLSFPLPPNPDFSPRTYQGHNKGRDWSLPLPRFFISQYFNVRPFLMSTTALVLTPSGSFYHFVVDSPLCQHLCQVKW